MPEAFKLDRLDLRILAQLQKNGRITNVDLADAVGLSPSAVQRRLTRYRRSGLLRTVAVLDPKALPGTTLTAVWVTMERESLKAHAAFAARMRAAPEVQQCYVLAGEWDYLVILATRGIDHFRSVAQRLFVDEGTIRRYDSRIVFDVVKHGLALPTGESAPRRRR